MKKDLFEKKPILLLCLLIVITLLVILLYRYVDMEKLNGLLNVLIVMGVIVYVGWINSSIIALKKKVKELQKEVYRLNNIKN